ncbi:PREDICTED: solute carrier family 25 member 35-like [Nicrophorus vespilloides]|uniref:Solute carrier family 25 member 35-like n=1 Tax=Nicrophorus vespilloides TaxID=110193 RepID=A0ABM1N4Q7_NICVS|nr:PREDICTED: solute carrier family 25 member 35-like [Nicrophorus vespilloides]
MEFGVGGLAAVCAGFFTNPLEVMKVRMQLQGELNARGKHAVHYRNVFHAGYVIAKHDGILALQAGLVPALWFQLFLNGFRLGSYQTLANRGFMTDEKGKIVFYRTVIAGGVCGGVGAIIGSPLYLIKTHLQANAAKEIAFGHQHQHGGMVQGFANIFKSHGVTGLFRGASAAIPRAFFGSTAQLTSFNYCKVWLANYDFFKGKPLSSTFAASMVGGIVVAVVMTPFDLISTRLYNQGVDAKGKGLLYNNYLDCVLKIQRSEGFLGFYKGLGACYFRLGPHTVLTLVFWDQLKSYYDSYQMQQKM